MQRENIYPAWTDFTHGEIHWRIRKVRRLCIGAETFHVIRLDGNRTGATYVAARDSLDAVTPYRIASAPPPDPAAFEAVNAALRAYRDACLS